MKLFHAILTAVALQGVLAFPFEAASADTDAVAVAPHTAAGKSGGHGAASHGAAAASHGAAAASHGAAAANHGAGKAAPGKASGTTHHGRTLVGRQGKGKGKYKGKKGKGTTDPPTDPTPKE